MKTKRLTVMAMLTAVALTIFVAEAQIPTPVPLPGVKLGLSNVVTVFAVFTLGSGQAAAILFARIFLGAVFAGNFSSILYSGMGGLCAILTTIALKRIVKPDQLWVASCLGAVSHSIGQMAVAVVMTGTPSILIYLPALVVCSIITGTFTGLCAQLLVNRGKKFWKTFLN